MTKNLDLAQLRQRIQTAQSAPSAGLVMKLIQELEEARARHRKAWGRAEVAEAAVQRVRELHKPTPARYYGTDLNPQRRNDCAACGEGTVWPCATIRALDGGEQV